MVRRRRSPLPLHKQRNSRKKHSTRSSKGKAEPTTGGVLAIPEELETVILSEQGIRHMGFIKY